MSLFTHKLIRILLTSLCMSVALVSASPAFAAKKKITSSHRVAKPKQDHGSAESTPERERRLKRECRGRPNAGACEGYTRLWLEPTKKRIAATSASRFFYGNLHLKKLNAA